MRLIRYMEYKARAAACGREGMCYARWLRTYGC